MEKTKRRKMTEEEIIARWGYITGFIGVCLLWGVVVTVASGILG